MFLTSQASGWLGIQIFQMSPGLILSDFLWMETPHYPLSHGFWAHYISKAWTKHHPKKVQHGSTADQTIRDQWPPWILASKRLAWNLQASPACASCQTSHGTKTHPTPFGIIGCPNISTCWLPLDLPAVGSMVLEKSRVKFQVKFLSRWLGSIQQGSTVVQHLNDIICVHFFLILKLISLPSWHHSPGLDSQGCAAQMWCASAFGSSNICETIRAFLRQWGLRGFDLLIGIAMFWSDFSRSKVCKDLVTICGLLEL